jgi:cytochrome c oxidase assembly factor CtaG
MTSWFPVRWHLLDIAVCLVAFAAHTHFVRSTHERRLAAGALAAWFAVTWWPIGDLAATTSITAATVQRLVIMLLVAPLALRSIPLDRMVRLTRPAPIDAVARWLSHPGLALFLVTVGGTLTLSSGVVDAGARSGAVRALIVAAVGFLGVVLWLPALGIVPGARRLSPVARAGYLFGSSLLVTSLSFVWIFSRHPLYPALHGQHLLNLSPLLDQQLAGFVAKLGAYLPMWLTAFIIFFRADESGEEPESSPLHWADVERELLRADRRRARHSRAKHPEGNT